jgi:hypothetical protein
MLLALRALVRSSARRGWKEGAVEVVVEDEEDEGVDGGGLEACDGLVDSIA